MACRRDWANLTDGPAGKIAERLLVDDVSDYLRFRAVCSQWRRCTESPHVHNCMDRRFHPRRWIMLPWRTLDDIWKCKRRDFLNVSTGERIQVDLPERRRQFVFGPTSEGLILMCDKHTYIVQLLNPLTRQLMALPNATTLLCSLNREVVSWSNRLGTLRMYAAGLADHSSIALDFDDHGQVLAIAKPNVERWSRCALPGSDPMITALSFAGRFYGVTKKGVMVMDLTAAGQRPQLVVAVEMNEDLFLFHRGFVNLVDNDDELILVCRTRTKMPWYKTHRVDLDAGKTVPMNGLQTQCTCAATGTSRLTTSQELTPTTYWMETWNMNSAGTPSSTIYRATFVVQRIAWFVTC